MMSVSKLRQLTCQRRVRPAVGLVLVMTVVMLSAHRATAQEPKSRPPVTFTRDVAPLLYRHCASCHRPGQSAPFSLLSYEDARQRARLMAAAVSTHVMPPWQPDGTGQFAGERRLSDREIETFAAWVADGTREGEAADRPQVPTFTDGWFLGRPDVVIEMPDMFSVPADGADVFRNFALPIPLSDRRFVRAVEFRPGNARVVHHARLLLDDTGDMRRRDLADPEPGFGGMDVPGARFPDGHFLGWAPGKMPTREAYAWPLEPGNDLVMQLHLKPTGRSEQVRASVGLYFTDTPPSATPVMLRLGSKTIDIAPGDASYELVDSFTVPVDVAALGIYPHAHYLATEMSVVAQRPDGRTVSLLRIPRWDFNWQDEYTYARPVALPRGTTIEMRYRYDNSADNPRNPFSPPQRIRFGQGTRDEMGELLLQVLPSQPAQSRPLLDEVARKNLLTDIAGEEKRVADVPTDAETRNALGVDYMRLGRVADAVAQIEASLRTNPDLAVAHYNLGVIALGRQRFPDAVAQFERTLALQPEYAEAHNNLGIALESTGRGAPAEAHYRAALVTKPSLAAAHNNLGRVLLARGAVGEALDAFRTALRARPDNPDVLYNLGRAFIANNQPVDAARQWRRAVAIRPDSPVVTLDLAWLLATQEEVRDPHEAVTLAEGVNRRAPDSDPVVLDVLAAAYAADGRPDLAVRTAQRALQRATAQNNSTLASEIMERLQRYQQMAQGRAGEPGIP